MPVLEIIDRNSWEEFLNSPVAVLVLGKNGCQACAEWTEELNGWFSGGTAPDQVRFGKILLDTPGMGRFKIAQSWVSDVDVLPFNAIFINGERVKEWAGGKLNRLENRLSRLL